MEALDAGVTTVVDHAHLQMSEEHSGALAQGFLDSGIRGIYSYGVYRNPTFKPGDKIDRVRLKQEVFGSLSDFHRANAERIRDRYFPSNDGLVKFGLATSEFAAFPEVQPVLDEISWARTLEPWRISCHICVGGEGELHVVEPLAEAGLLGPEMLFVHGSYLTDNELDLIVQYGASVSTTPETELQMGMGYPVAERLEAAGGQPSLGIDIVSNFAGDMFGQMRMMLQTKRFRDFEREGNLPATPRYPAEKMLQMATIGGARALGLDDVVGSLTPGKQADILMIRTDSIAMSPINDVAAAVMFYTNVTDIEHVMVNGRFVKRDGKLTIADWSSLRQKVEKSRDGIMERVARIPLNEIQDAWASFYTPEAMGE